MTTRKDFLAASLLTTSLLATPEEVAAQTGGAQFDYARFKRSIARAAKHKHLFAAGSIRGGEIVTSMYNTYYVYERVLRTPDSDVLMAGVFYHGLAVAMALNDNAWNQFVSPALSSLPGEFRNDAHTLPPVSGNPLLRGGANGSLTGLVNRGSVFFVCGNALMGVAGAIAQALGRAPAGVYAQISRSLIKGAQVVPTGVWAIHALQEARFTYLQSSL